MSALTKHQVVVKLDAEMRKFISFVADTEGPDYEEVTLPRDLWEDMRKPDTITITIEPGDTLGDAPQT